MSNVGYATLTILPSAKGFASALKGEIETPMARSGKSAGERSGNAFASGFKALVVPALAILGTGVFAGFISDAATASDATDKFKSTMSFAGLDNKAINAAAKAAKDYADQTVFDLPTIQAAMSQLASNGIKDYTGLTKAAGNLNAIAGGSPETFKSVTMALTQTAGAGKLTTENWNQLTDAIPGASGVLQEAMRKNGAFTGNFRDAMADGQITSEEFNTALMQLGSDPIAVEAAKSTKTFEGSVGNLQATINSGLMGTLDKLKPLITDAFGGMSDILGGVFDYISTTVVPIVLDLAKGFKDNVVPRLKEFGDYVVQTIVPNVAAFAKEVSENLAPHIKDLSDFFKTDVIPRLTDMYNTLKDDVLPKLGEFGQWCKDNGEVIKNVSEVIGILLIPALGRLAFAAVTSAVTQAAAWVMTGASAIGAGVIYVVQSALIVARWILMGVTATVQGLIIAGAWVVGIIGPAVAAGIAMVVQAAIVVGGWVLMATQATINALRMAAAWLIALGPVGWIIGIVGLLVGVVIANWGKISKFTSEAWSNISRFVADAWNNIVSWVKGAVSNVWNAITGAMNNVRNTWRAAWTTVGSVLSGAWNGIVNGVSGGVGQVVSFFSSLIGKITGALGNAGNALWSTGQNIIQGLINGIGSMMGKIGAAIVSLVPGPIVGVFKDLLGIHSPSRVFRGFGVNIGEGLILGIQDMHGDVEKSMSALAAIPANTSFQSPEVTQGGIQGALAYGAGTAGSGQPTIHQENHFNTPMSEEAYAELAARKLLRAGVGR